MNLINQLETSKGMISDLDGDAFGRSSLSAKPPPLPTIHEYLGMNFNKPDEEEDWMTKLKKSIRKKYEWGDVEDMFITYNSITSHGIMDNYDKCPIIINLWTTLDFITGMFVGNAFKF